MLVDCRGWTVAMHIAYKGQNIPEYWDIPKNFKSNSNETVASLYAVSRGSIPEKYR